MGSVSLINGHIDDDTPRMTPQEAKSWFEEDLKDGKCSDDCPECNAKELAILALEKQIPKKVYKNLKETYGIDMHPYHCPTCKRYVSLRGYVRRDKFPVNKRYVYCNYCGQALDWSDTEE